MVDDYEELVYICGYILDQINYFRSKVNIKIVLGAAIILGAIIYTNLNSILRDFNDLFNKYKFNIKYVLAAITTIGALVYTKFITTNDLPMCPHSEISSPRRPLSIKQKQYGCHGHRPDSINLSELKTGDIIMISYGGLRSLFSSIFYNSVWVHTGIVWVDNKTNEIYIFEAANYFPPYIGEVVRIPILKWMKINRNAKAIAIIPINQKISDESFECAAKKYENTKIVVESLRPSWFRFLKTKRICDLPEDHFFSDKFTNSLVKKKGEKIFYITCQELTIAALQEAGVIEKNITPCSFLPSTVYNRKFNCINGFSYSEPKQISFHEHVGEITNSIEY